MAVGYSDPDHHPARPAFSLGHGFKLERDITLVNGGGYGNGKRLAAVDVGRAPADRNFAGVILAITGKIFTLSF